MRKRRRRKEGRKGGREGGRSEKGKIGERERKGEQVGGRRENIYIPWIQPFLHLTIAQLLSIVDQ